MDGQDEMWFKIERFTSRKSRVTLAILNLNGPPFHCW
jgi:hypothetical protein